MSTHNELGNMGEKEAQNFLQNHGYQILQVNWHYQHLELDIIAQKDEMLIVVEVKTRSTDYFEHPAEAITPKKIKRIINATEQYIIDNDWNGETRFDIISVIRHPKGKFHIEHIEDAFSPSVL